MQAQMKVDVYNPNLYAVSVKDANVTLFVNEEEVGDLILLEGQDIRPESRATVLFARPHPRRCPGQGAEKRFDESDSRRRGALHSEGKVTAKAFGLSFNGAFEAQPIHEHSTMIQFTLSQRLPSMWTAFFAAVAMGLSFLSWPKPTTGILKIPWRPWSKPLNVRHIGPGTMSGRVTAIAVPHNEPEVIFVGTASGGLWKSTSAGVTWEPIFDDQPTQSIGAVALSPLNPDLVWVGTGEGNPRNSHTSGRGLFRSLDGGASWDYMGLEETRNIHRILIHPRDPNTVYVAATGSAWGDSPSRACTRRPTAAGRGTTS